MISDASVDLIDICLPTRLHAGVAVQAMEASRDVLIELPLATTFEDAQLAEQVVIAVPLAVTVQHDHQQIPALHPFEDLSGSHVLQDGVAQRCGHPIEDRGAAHKRHFRVGEVVKQFRA